MNDGFLKNILSETASACESCGKRLKCDENACPIFRIEKMCLDVIEPRGTYQCFHCLSNTVCWDSDYDFEDFGLDGEGIVQCCHCSNCGADIQYIIPLDDNEE